MLNSCQFPWRLTSQAGVDCSFQWCFHKAEPRENADRVVRPQLLVDGRELRLRRARFLYSLFPRSLSVQPEVSEGALARFPLYLQID